MIRIQKDRFTRGFAGPSPSKRPDSAGSAGMGTMLYAVV